MEKEKNLKLFKSLEKFYLENWKELLFHGWHHIIFVRKKSLIFARDLNANEFLVEAAALTHDLNYSVKINSTPKDWEDIRNKFLIESGFSDNEIDRINEIIIEEDISTRDENISIEAKALSDADTLFKALPITPIIFSSKYITENNVDIKKLADKIISEQVPLFKKDIYFYSNLAKNKYSKWAEVDLKLWEFVKESLEDDDVIEILDIAKSQNIL